MCKLNVTPEVSALQDRWIEAKNAEAGWLAVRLDLENQMNELLKPVIDDLTKQMQAGATLSKSVTAGKLAITVGETLEINQVEAVQFLANHPDMLGVMFERVLKEVARPVTSIVRNKDSGLHADLTKVVKVKAKKIGYAAK